MMELYLINQQGASIARRFAQAYSVILLARNSANFDPLVKEINTAGGQALGIRADLSDSTSVHSALDQITKQYHGSSLAAAVFNVGGGFVRKPFLELTETEFSQGFESQGWVTYLPFPSPAKTSKERPLYQDLRQLTLKQERRIQLRPGGIASPPPSQRLAIPPDADLHGRDRQCERVG